MTKSCHYPLANVRVVELSDGKGEMCGRILADLGAEVILVEPPEGSPSRQCPPLKNGHSLHFASHNANKRSVLIDLHTEQGRQDFLMLIDSADIFIETMKPGALAALDLSIDFLRKQNPTLVAISISDFGQTGPYRDYRGSNAIHMAMGGVLARSGIEGERPLLPPSQLALETTAIQAAWVVMVAYWQRLQTGRGNYLDFSIFEATAQILDPGLGVTGSASAGRSAGEMASFSRPPVGKLYPIFSCADGFVRVCVLNPRQWQGMSGWLGDNHAFTDPEYGNLAKRFSKLDEVNALMSGFFKDKKQADLVKEGQHRGVPIAAVSTPAQVLNDEHFNARGAFTNLTLADDKLLGKLPSGYFELDGQRIGIRKAAPALGEDQSLLQELPSFLSNRETVPLSARRPFEGLRILDLGVIVAGAELGRLFADQGAEVVKVENSAFPDGLRQSSAGVAISQSFSQGSRNKLSLGLNLRTEKGIALFRQLAASTDVLLSNFKPGTLESLGIGYEQLKAINPAIVVLESSALGNTGPLAKSMGYGPLVRAATGLTGLWCYPEIDSSYSDSTTIFPDHFAARIAGVGIVAALIQREKTAQGGKIVLSQAEVILNTLSTDLLRESLEPGSFKPQGNQYEFNTPANVFPCAGEDLWCVIEVQSDADWQKLCGVIGRNDLAACADYQTAVGRLVHRDALEDIVREWTKQHSPYEVMDIMQAAGVAAGNMQRLTEFDDNPHFIARKFFRHFEQPGFPGILQTENGPVSFSELPDPQINPAPFQGQHTVELAERLLGLSAEQISLLTEEGVLEPMAENEFLKS